MHTGRNMCTVTVSAALIFALVLMQQLSAAANLPARDLPDGSTESNASGGVPSVDSAMGSDSCCQGSTSWDVPDEKKNVPDKNPCCPDGCKHCDLACCGEPAWTISPLCVLLGHETESAIVFLANNPPRIESTGIFHPPRR